MVERSEPPHSSNSGGAQRSSVPRFGGLNIFKVATSRPRTTSDSGTSSGATDLPSGLPWRARQHLRHPGRHPRTARRHVHDGVPRLSRKWTLRSLAECHLHIRTDRRRSRRARDHLDYDRVGCCPLHGRSLGLTTPCATPIRAPAWSWSAPRPPVTHAQSLYRHCEPSARPVRPRFLPWQGGISRMVLAL